MLEVMMALGGYRFSLATAAYDSLERTAAWRWPAQDVLGTHPVRQYVGPGEQTIRLSGTIYPHYKGLLGLPNLLSRVPALAGALGTVASARSALTRMGVGLGGTGAWQLEAMREDANSGAPLLLTDGRGLVWGWWVIDSLTERERRHMADGAALAVDFDIALSYYGDTAEGGIAAAGGLMGAVRGVLGI
jgi:phage protein U